MIKKESIFLKILIITVATILVTLTVNSGLMLYFGEKYLIDQALESEMTNLKRSSYASELVIEEARELAIQLHTNLNIQKLLYFSNVSQMESDFAMRTLQSFQGIGKEVHSIYVLNRKTQMVYYSGKNLKVSSLWDLDDFFDKEFLYESLNHNRVNKYFPHRRVIHEIDMLTDDVLESDVYSFVVSFSHQQRYETASLIVINVSVDRMKEAIASLDQTPEHPLYVVTSQGELMFGTSQNLPLVTHNFPQFLKNHGSEFHQKIHQGEDEVMVVGYQSPLLTDWYFLKVLELPALLAKTRDAKHIILIISLLVLFVAMLIAMFSLLSMRKPIHALIESAEQAELRTERDRNALLHSRFMSLLDFYADYSSDDVGRILGQCHPQLLASEPFYTMVLSVQNWVHPLIAEFVQNAFSRILGDGGFVQFSFAQDAQLIVFQKRNSQELDALLHPFQQELQAFWDGDVVLAYNKEGVRLEDLGHGIRQIQSFHPYLRKFRFQPILSLSHLQHRHESHGIYPKNQERALLSAILKEEVESIDPCVNGFMDDLLNFSLAFYQRALVRLITAVYEGLIERIQAKVGVPREFDLEGILESLWACQTHREDAQYMVNLFTRMQAALGQDSEVTEHDTIASIIAYIMNHYENPGLGSEMIADAMNMNTTYMLRVFKRETRIPLHRYINDFRLKKAEGLLKSTSLSVNDIIFRVGFANQQSFFRLFKEAYKQTPSQFRETFSN